MATSRPVRISRAAPRRVATVGPGERTRRYWDSEADGSSSYESNTAGTSRAVRVFALFAGGLVVILGLFGALAATSPDPGISQSVTIYALLGLTTLVLAMAGALITLVRAPRGASFGAREVLVTERLGRRRRWPVGAALKTRVLQSYPSGVFNADPTELIELSDGAGHRAAYLVGRGFFDRAESPAVGG